MNDRKLKFITRAKYRQKVYWI